MEKDWTGPKWPRRRAQKTADQVLAEKHRERSVVYFDGPFEVFWI